jgi:hypothetical protein
LWISTLYFMVHRLKKFREQRCTVTVNKEFNYIEYSKGLSIDDLTALGVSKSIKNCVTSFMYDPLLRMKLIIYCDWWDELNLHTTLYKVLPHPLPGSLRLDYDDSKPSTLWKSSLGSAKYWWHFLTIKSLLGVPNKATNLPKMS